MIFDKSRTKE